MPGSNESFVDVTYQGLEVGRRVKLTEVAPDSGYLEVAAPMPIGTTLALAIDDTPNRPLEAGEGRLSLTAVVRGVHEQVGGSDHPPGMRVAPVLTGDAAARWWAERVTIAAAPPRRRTHEMTAAEEADARGAAERARVDSGAPPFVEGRRTRQMAPGEVQAALAAAQDVAQKLVPRPPLITPVDGIPAAVVDEDGLIDDGRKTEVMAAVDPEILARLTSSGELPAIDDGKRTIVMTVPPVMDDDDTGGDDDTNGDDSGDDGNGGGEEPAPSASGKLPAARGKGKRRRKRR